MADQNFLDPRDEQMMRQDTGPGLADRWRGWLASPQNQAFLIQAGTAMLQPRPEGQTAIGQIAGSLGAGGEAAARVSKQEEEATEAASRQAYRASNADANQQKGEAALLRGQAALDRAATLAEGGGRPMTEAQRLQFRLKAQTKYRDWIAKPEDPIGEPLLKILGAKTKVDVEQNPELRRRALEWFYEGAPDAAPASRAVPQQNQTPVPGNSRIMTPSEGVASGAYNATEVSNAVEAIYAGKRSRESILQQYEQRTGRPRSDVLGQL